MKCTGTSYRERNIKFHGWEFHHLLLIPRAASWNYNRSEIKVRCCMFSLTNKSSTTTIDNYEERS